MRSVQLAILGFVLALSFGVAPASGQLSPAPSLNFTNPAPPTGPCQSPCITHQFQPGTTINVTWTGGAPDWGVTVRLVRTIVGMNPPETIVTFENIPNTGALQVQFPNDVCNAGLSAHYYDFWLTRTDLATGQAIDSTMLRTSGRFAFLCPQVLSGTVGVVGLDSRRPGGVRPPSVGSSVSVQGAAGARLPSRCAPPPPGMQFWLAFDNGYADLIAGLIGVPQSVSLSTDSPSGHAPHVASIAAGGRVTLPSSPALAVGVGDFTIDAWIRIPPSNVQNIPLIDTRTAHVGNVRGFLLFVYEGRIGFQMADGSYSNFVSNTAVANGAWRHVAVTVDRDAAQGGRIYVDSALVHTFDPRGRSGSLGASASMRLGHDAVLVGAGAPFDIDEVELFGRALAPNEIGGLWWAPKCRPGTYEPVLP